MYFDLWSILIDRSCRILVLDVDSNLVYFFDDRGYLLCLIGWGFLEKFVGISLDFEGNLYVVEYYIGFFRNFWLIKYNKWFLLLRRWIKLLLVFDIRIL